MSVNALANLLEPFNIDRQTYRHTCIHEGIALCMRVQGNNLFSVDEYGQL